MEKRFRILRIVGTLYKVLAWIVLVTGVLSAFGSLIFSVAGGALIPQEYGQGLPIGGAVLGITSFLTLLIVSAFQFVLFYSVGELIYLLLAIEENTREVALWMRSRGGGQPQVAVVQPGSPPYSQG